MMYRKIASAPDHARDLRRAAVTEGALAADEATRWSPILSAHLESQFEAAKSYKPNKADWLEGKWPASRPLGRRSPRRHRRRRGRCKDVGTR
jgi:2-oxoglutarate dehydrogenase E1 component